MSMSHIGSVSSPGLIDAKLEEHRMSGSRRHCPNCGHKLDQKPDWIGLPAGVKFDPTDQELIEHLEAKVYEEKSKLSHPLIDEFIPTIEGEDGICYTHPEKLPGVTRDGLSKHFFHRPSKAYTTGTRKRRKVQTECDLQRRSGETRWHKTGKTRPVLVGGEQKGCKKILVLYTNFGKHRKPEKTSWVMHQYHLGESEEEKEGELVVSKIFYQTQPRQCGWSADRTCSSKAEASRDNVSFEGGGNFIGFPPLRKTFDEVGIGEASTKMIRDVTTHHQEHNDREEHDEHHMSRERQEAVSAAYNIGRPTNLISNIISPVPLHRSSTALEDPFQVSRIQFQHQQRKLVERPSAAGLEELIMGCTPSSSRGEPSIPHPQEPEWLKYSYWSPDNQDHH